MLKLVIHKEQIRTILLYGQLLLTVTNTPKNVENKIKLSVYKLSLAYTKIKRIYKIKRVFEIKKYQHTLKGN